MGIFPEDENEEDKVNENFQNTYIYNIDIKIMTMKILFTILKKFDEAKDNIFELNKEFIRDLTEELKKLHGKQYFEQRQYEDAIEDFTIKVMTPSESNYCRIILSFLCQV